MTSEEHGRPDDKGLPPGLDKNRDGILDSEQEVEEPPVDEEEEEDDEDKGPPEGKGWRREDHPGQGRGVTEKKED